MRPPSPSQFVIAEGKKGRRERERERDNFYFFIFFSFSIHMAFSEQKYGAHKDHVIKLTENLTVLV
ncbi:hypothetical protein DVH24_037636 [Malus domestica]|uniref:Uncharacterized protein n=1 Tax=Malus domestica TaxID=3750 RepID=A0A498J3F8_MALDO|nr:hypothetical protein DVH24_037636 [Malus domestica]